MTNKNSKKSNKTLAVNLIVIGIAGAFIPILPAILLIVAGILLMFPNFYYLLKDRLFKDISKP